MHRRLTVSAIWVPVFAAVLLLGVSSWSAGALAATNSVLDQQQFYEWMRRLEGKFRLDGTVELPEESAVATMVSIRGQAECRGGHSQRRSGNPPILVTGVECFLDMTWEQSSTAEPTKHSAVLLYGNDSSDTGARFMLVDDDGVAEGGVAHLSNGILVSTSPCARIKGKCLNKVSITAGPDLRSVKVEMSMEVEGRRVGARQLTLHREAVAP